MSSDRLSDTRDFDLRGVAAQLNPLLKRRRQLLSVGIAGLLGFAVILIAVSARPLSGHSFSVYVASGLIGLVFIVCGGAAVLYQWRRHSGPSADKLTLDGSGIRLEYPEVRTVVRPWDNPRLRVELGDASEIPSGSLLAGSPYSIEVDGDISLLTQPAFAGVLECVHKHGLVDRTGFESVWALSSEPNTVVHHIRASRPLASKASENQVST